jgi:hypothetical protein
MITNKNCIRSIWKIAKTFAAKDEALESSRNFINVCAILYNEGKLPINP